MDWLSGKAHSFIAYCSLKTLITESFGTLTLLTVLSSWIGVAIMVVMEEAESFDNWQNKEVDGLCSFEVTAFP